MKKTKSRINVEFMRLWRRWRDKPIQSLRRAAEIIAIPLAVLWLLNHENPHYKDLDPSVKDNYFLIPNYADRDKNGYARTFIRFPKSREYGVVLGGLLERAGGVIEGQSFEEAFAGYGESLGRSFLFSNPATENVVAPLLYNLPQNKSWSGAPIVPEAMKGLEPRYQYDYSTSEIGKRVGGVLNASPKQVDYLIDQYTGIIGDIALPLTTGTNRTAAERGQAVLNPIVRKFVADPLYSSAPVDELYRARDSAKTVADTKSFVEDIPEGITTPEERKLWYLNSVATDISRLRKQERKFLETDAPDSEVRAIRTEINNIARGVEERARTFEVRYKDVYDRINTVEQHPAWARATEKDKESIWGSMATYATAKAMLAENPNYEHPRWITSADRAHAAGIPAADYFIFRYVAAHMQADKAADANGNLALDRDGNPISIPGSKKAKIARWLNAQNLTAKQKQFLFELVGYK